MSATLDSEYFSGLMARRQALLWAIATRRQLDRWEALVASIVREQVSAAGTVVWEAEVERHFALIAGRNLLWALDLPGSEVVVDRSALETVKNLRDVHEHWNENMPVFNVSPLQEAPPRKSGQTLAAQEPDRTPFSQFAWNSTEGPMLWSGLPAATLRAVLDEIEEQVLAADPSLERFRPPRAPSPWLGEAAGADRWWPLQQAAGDR